MAKTPPKLKVFLCHASEDKPIVRELYDRLRADGFDPWLDSELLDPGENWPLEIQKAMRASQAVIVCLSEAAIVKEGYIHTEIKTAQSLQMEKPEGTIFFIPLQLEECEPPFSMREIQWGKYHEPDGYERLVRALNKRAGQVKAAQGVIKSRKKKIASETSKPAAKIAPGTGNSVQGGDGAAVVGRDANQSVIVPGSGNVINIYQGGAPEQVTSQKPEEEEEEPPAEGLPPGSYLPFVRNALFTGREKDLAKLAEALLPEGASGGDGRRTVVTQAVTGMGGFGKTQLAVEFAYRFGSRFAGVHWLDLRDPSTLDGQIAACGEKMALQPWSKELPEQVALTERAWSAGGARLLILDNFESPAKAAPVLSRFQSPNLRLLVTSRRTDWPAALGMQSVPLNVFDEAESRAFLRQYLKDGFTDGELDQLAKRLGRLPLALELAGRYFALHPRLSVEKYLERLERVFEHDSMRGWRSDLPNATAHDLDLLATFSLSWEQVTDEAARKVFLAAGCCAANTPIPETIFERAVKLDENACDEALQTLIGLGLLGEKITIHPLLAEFARHLDGKGEALRELADALGKLAEEQNEAVDKSGKYALYTPFLPHVRAAAETAEGARLTEAGPLWNSLGYHLHALADYRGARDAFERALKIWEANLGPEHPDVATAANNLGGVLHDLGDLSAARAAYERALKIDEAAFGPEHPKVATDVNNLGSVLHDQGDLPAARAAFERALKIDEAAFGPEHPNVACDVNNLGGVLQAQGDLPAARAAYERALKIDEAVFGPEHTNVATRVNNLGGVLQAQGDLPAARAAYERALKILEANLGPEHPNVATAVNNLGGVLQAQGDLPAAHAAYERALKIDEAAFGPEHPDVARDVNNLGSVLQAQGDLPAARAAYERALKIDEAAFGPEHPNVARDVNNLGSVLHDQGDLPAARDAFERALKIWEANLGPEHPNVATTVNNLGLALHGQGDLPAARAAFERALKIDEAAFGPEHPEVARDVNNLGSVLQDLGDLPAARAAFERALKIWKKTLPPEHPHIKIAQNNLDSLPKPPQS